MKNKIKKIRSLTKVLINENFNFSSLFNRQNKKLDKKSIFFWTIVIIAIIVGYISYSVINWLNRYGMLEEVFLPVYMVLLFFIIYFQISMIIPDVLFFSKDTEKILVFPIKSDEIVTSKVINVLVSAYIMELILGVIPLAIYASFVAPSAIYYLLALIILVLLPVILAMFEAIISILLLKIFIWIKNKNILQIVISLIMYIPILFFLVKIQDFNLENFSEIIKYLVIVNPMLAILNVEMSFNSILNGFLELFILGIGLYIILIFISKFFYLKSLLRCLETNKTKIRKENNKKIKSKKKLTIFKTYMKKEIKDLFKHPVYLIRCFSPILIILVVLITIVFYLIPIIDSGIQDEKTIKSIFASIPINTEVIGIILSIIQVLLSFIPLSLTAISRKGKEARLMKYIPVDYYKQFIYNTILQTLTGGIAIAVFFVCINNIMPQLEIKTFMLVSAISLIIDLINSFIMLFINFRNPNLNWDSERNGNDRWR